MPSGDAALSSTRSGTLLVLGAAVLWGSTGTARTLAPDDATAFQVALVRLGIGAIGLIIVAAGLRQLPRLGGIAGRPLLLAVAALAASQPLWFAAVEQTGVAVAAIVSIGTALLLAGTLRGGFVTARDPGR